MGRMRRPGRVLAALLLLALLGGPAGAGARSHAQLRIVHSAPLTVAGAGFASRERVRLSLRGGARSAVRTVTARADGTFTARFAGVALGHCGAASIVASGSRGSRASVTRHLGVASCNPN